MLFINTDKKYANIFKIIHINIYTYACVKNIDTFPLWEYNFFCMYCICINRLLMYIILTKKGFISLIMILLINKNSL